MLVDGWKLTRRFLGRGILYSAFVELTTVAAVSPLITWVFYQLRKISGDPVRLNDDLLDLFLSPRVLIGL